MELNGQVDVFAFLKEQEVEEVEYKKEIKEEAVDVTLYEMTDSFLNISNLDTMSESEKENIKQVLMKEIASKSSNIIKVIRNKEAQIEQIDNEIKRLTELKKVKQNDINSIKGYGERLKWHLNKTYHNTKIIVKKNFTCIQYLMMFGRNYRA